MKATVYWIDGPWPGKLGIVPRPRGGDWLEDEVAAWHAVGIDVVVSALTPSENEDLELGQESREVEKQGLHFVSFPISDRSVPGSMQTTEKLVRGLEKELAEGKAVAVHCRQGIGRSSLLAGSLLVAAGVEPGQAWQRIALARGCAVPDTGEQRDWLVRFAKQLVPALRA